jgi:hypothetical protein
MRHASPPTLCIHIVRICLPFPAGSNLRALLHQTLHKNGVIHPAYLNMVAEWSIREAEVACSLVQMHSRLGGKGYKEVFPFLAYKVGIDTVQVCLAIPATSYGVPYDDASDRTASNIEIQVAA